MIRPATHRPPQSKWTRRARADRKARTKQTAWPVRVAWKCSAPHKPRKQPRPARLAASAAG